MDEKTIVGLKNYYVNTLYSTKVKEQNFDYEFYRDMFDVPQILEPVKLMRSGTARKLVDDPAAHIITSNPQAFRKKYNDSQAEEDRKLRILTMLNDKWLLALRSQNPNKLQSHVKFQLLAGEAWIQTLHNSAWTTSPVNKTGSPVFFRIPDPTLVYASPNEDADGVPDHIFLIYDRDPNEVQFLYPHWANPMKKGLMNPQLKEKVHWWEYWDKDTRYFCADDSPVLKSEKNPYGFVPFVHKIAPWGIDTGKMEDLIVGRLRYSRDTLRRKDALVSSIDYAIHTFANRSFDVQGDDMHSIPADFIEKYIIGTGIMHELPPGLKVTRSEEALPEQSIFQYMRAVDYQLEMENPLPLSGQAAGDSGRLQDMIKSDALIRYAPLIENTEMAFSTAVGQACRMVDTIAGLRPDDIKKGDFNNIYTVDIKLKADDPLENDRKATLGSRMLTQKEIDPIRNLVQFKGYTEEEANKTMVDVMMWTVLLENPEISAFIGFKAAQKSGMADELKAFMQQKQQGQAQGITPPAGASEQQQRMGETQTPEGFNMIDQALTQRGTRNPPTPYNRGE